MENIKSGKFSVLGAIFTKNCEDTIVDMLTPFFDYAIAQHIGELIIIDNASSDSTISRAKEFMDKNSAIFKLEIKIFKNVKNQGLGGSHKLAFKYAHEHSYDYLLIQHGDDSSQLNDFLDKIYEKDLLENTMILSNRFFPFGKRINYQCLRLLGNIALNLMATLGTLNLIKDFSGGPINIYRVKDFIDKFENSTIGFANDVTFSQDMLLYGLYHRVCFKYIPITLKEKDNKTFYRMFSQFVKSIMLLINYQLCPAKIFKRNLDKGLLAFEYREITSIKRLEESSLILKRSDELKQHSFSKSTKCNSKDRFLFSYYNISLTDVEASENTISGELALKLIITPELISSYAPYALILHLVKLYSAENLIIDLVIDHVMGHKKLDLFLHFLKDLKIDYMVFSEKVESVSLWLHYTNFVPKISLAYTSPQTSRLQFFDVVNIVGRSTELAINIMCTQEHFYFIQGLYIKCDLNKTTNTLLLHPYNVENLMPQDHINIFKNYKRSFNLGRREHRMITSKEIFWHHHLETMVPKFKSEGKTIYINDNADIYFNNKKLVGNLFIESSYLTSSAFTL